MNNKIIAIGGIRNRRYHYPKGYIDPKTKKPKTGFMPSTKGARLYVQSNLKDISRGKIDYDNLTTREKQVYKALTSDRALNTFKFHGDKYYDPTGIIRNSLERAQIPTKVKDLTNYLSKENFKKLFRAFTPAGKIDKLNLSFFEFSKGAKKERYRSNRGDLLDVSHQLKRLEKDGYSISIDGKSGRDAILYLKKWENKAVDEAIEKSKYNYKDGDKIKIEVLHKVNIDPYSKEIFINTKDTKVHEYYPQELLDKIEQSKLERQNKKKGK